MGLACPRSLARASPQNRTVRLPGFNRTLRRQSLRGIADGWCRALDLPGCRPAMVLPDSPPDFRPVRGLSAGFNHPRGPDRTRTCRLPAASRMLYLMSYRPMRRCFSRNLWPLPREPGQGSCARFQAPPAPTGTGSVCCRPDGIRTRTSGRTVPSRRGQPRVPAVCQLTYWPTRGVLDLGHVASRQPVWAAAVPSRPVRVPSGRACVSPKSSTSQLIDGKPLKLSGFPCCARRGI